MKALNIDQSRMRKASAWLAEKFTELKLRFDDPKAGALLLFESLEALSLGNRRQTRPLDSSLCCIREDPLAADRRLRSFASAHRNRRIVSKHCASKPPAQF